MTEWTQLKISPNMLRGAMKVAIAQKKREYSKYAAQLTEGSNRIIADALAQEVTALENAASTIEPRTEPTKNK